MATIRFELFAPYNTEASLIGDFSDWEALPMDKDDSGIFSTEVDLADGDYNYKFRLRSKSWFLEEDTWVDIVDPYASKVIDDENQTGVVHIREGKRHLDDFEWQHDDKPLPPDHQLVIYEMHVGDFSGGDGDAYSRGQFKDVTAKLDYLTDLGVNALEIMPVEEYPGEHSWGYNPRHFFALESSYGPSEDLKELVDECHARGIRILKDGVYNHSESSSPLTQIDHDYWYHHEPEDPDNNWGPEFDYEHYDENLDTYPARKFIGDVIRYWVSEYHIDGIRFDAAAQVGNYDFMGWVVQEAKKTAGSKPFYAIAEHIPETPEIVGQGRPMDACWHDSFYFTLKSLMAGEQVDFERLKDAIDGQRQGFPGSTNLVNYLSNHDHNHVFADLGDKGILGAEAFKRAWLGAAILMTSIGVPLIWMGQEFGEYGYKTTEKNKLEWALLGNEENKALRELYKGLIRLRKENSSLHGTDINFFHENRDLGVLAYVRWNGEGSRVAIIINTSGNYLKDYLVPSFPADGVWHEWTNDYDLNVEGGNLVTDLAEYEAKVFVI